MPIAVKRLLHLAYIIIICMILARLFILFVICLTGRFTHWEFTLSYASIILGFGVATAVV